MLIRLSRRILFAATSFFALLGFIAVPVGEQTGLEHVRGFLRSDTGKQVVSTSGEVGSATRRQVLKWLGGTALPGTPDAGALPPRTEAESEPNDQPDPPPDAIREDGDGTTRTSGRRRQAPGGAGRAQKTDGTTIAERKPGGPRGSAGRTERSRTDQATPASPRRTDAESPGRVAIHAPPKKKTRDAEDDRTLNGSDFGRIIRIVQGIPNQRSTTTQRHPKNRER